MSEWKQDKKEFKKLLFPDDVMEEGLKSASEKGAYERLNGIITGTNKHGKVSSRSQEDERHTTLTTEIINLPFNGRWASYYKEYCPKCKSTVIKRGVLFNNDDNAVYVVNFEDNREKVANNSDLDALF